MESACSGESAGEIAGNTRKQREVCVPDPSEAVIVEDTPVPTLARLVALKLVSWRYNPESRGCRGAAGRRSGPQRGFADHVTRAPSLQEAA